MAERLEGPLLRHAQRAALLGVARRLGIGRFQANLIIAAVQHERGWARAAATPETPQEGWRLAPLAVMFTVQTLIVWGAWHVFGS